MIVYLDLFIIKNFIFNFLLVSICGKMLNLSINLKKYALASIIGTVLAVIALISNNLMLSYALKIVLGILMVITAYPIVSIKNVLNSSAIFLLSASFIGGNIIAMRLNYCFIAQIIGYIFSILILYILYKAYKNRQLFNKLKCQMKIEIDNKIFELNAFIDTGNNLKDDISGESVIFVCEERLEKELSKEILSILKSEVLNLDEKYYGKIKMFAYRTVENENKVAVGLKAKSIIIKYGQTVIKNENVIIAMSKTKFNECEALIGQNILEEGYVYGNIATFKNENQKVVE